MAIGNVLERFVEDTIVFIRGDMNISKRNSLRTPLLAHVMTKHKLRRTLTFHPSYHHFIGIGGEFDSDLDVLLYTPREGVQDILSEQICKNLNPLIDSQGLTSLIKW